jgi:GntR family transcriptional regulator, transcriptional repressor for pyruvate dehydrogenase complex
MKTSLEELFEPVKNKRTFEEVSDRLKELIFSGALQPGQHLPSENALAELFHVGRQSVREALRVLELSGFISIRPGIKGGAIIEGTMLSKISGIFLDTFKLHKISLEDCMQARKVIEGGVIGLVVMNADQSDINNLRDNITKARRKVESGKPVFEENIDFHKILVKASKNYTFSIVMESILIVFSDFKSRSVSVDREQSLRIIAFHEAIVDAIVAKDGEKAAEQLKKDLEGAEEILIGGVKRTRKDR